MRRPKSAHLRLYYFRLFVYVACYGSAQEGNDLSAGAAVIGAEASAAGARRDAVFRRPKHCVIIEHSLFVVAERVCQIRRRGLTEDAPQEGHEFRSRDRVALCMHTIWAKHR